jgi:hypothetical protein
MTTDHLKTGEESTPETSGFSNIPQTVNNVQHNESPIVTNLQGITSCFVSEIFMVCWLATVSGWIPGRAITVAGLALVLMQPSLELVVGD